MVQVETAPTEVPAETSTPETPSSPAAPSNPKKATTVKKSKKKAPAKPKAAKKPAKVKAVKQPKKEEAPAKPIKELQKGGTRLRMFLALKRFERGLTARQIKEKTGMLPNSGHLGVVLVEELATKRIKSDEVTMVLASGKESSKTVYLLTANGKKALADGKIEEAKRGVEFGSKWSKDRRAVEVKPTKKKAKTKKKAVAKK